MSLCYKSLHENRTGLSISLWRTFEKSRKRLESRSIKALQSILCIVCVANKWRQRNQIKIQWMYVVSMEQCKYIIFHSPKPITVCGLIGSKFNSIGRLVYKMSSSLQIQHFNKSFSTEDLFTSMKVISQRILSIFQFTCRILFCLSILFFGILKFSPFVQVSTSSSSFQPCLKLWSRIHSSWETLFTYSMILKMR